MKPKVLIGVTGGIAAYKAVDVASQLVKANCDVRVVMTEAATRFVAKTAHLVGKTEHPVDGLLEALRQHISP